MQHGRACDGPLTMHDSEHTVTLPCWFCRFALQTDDLTEPGLEQRGMVHHSLAKGGLRRGGFSKGA